MPKIILGLEISDDAITAVRVKGDLKGYQVTGCDRVEIEGDKGFDNAMKALFDRIGHANDICITTIPGEEASYRILQMPFRDIKKIRQTLPFEIEQMLPFPIEDMVIDFTINNRSGHSEILAASVNKSFISKYLGLLNSHGIDPDILDIRGVPVVSCLLRQEGTPENGIFIDIDEKMATMVLYLKRRVVLIRTFALNDLSITPAMPGIVNGKKTDTRTPVQFKSTLLSLCKMVENTIHAFASQKNETVRPERIFFAGAGALNPETEGLLGSFFDIPAEHVDLSRDKRVHMDEDISENWNPALMNGALALALRDSRHGRGFNFRKDEFEIKKQHSGLKKEIRRSVILLLVIFSFVAVDLGVDYYFMEKRNRILDRKITEVFKQTFPEVKRIVDPLQQLKIKLNEATKSAVSYPGMKGGGKVLDILRDISQRVPVSLNVHIIRMVIDPDTVRINGYTDTFNTVDNIKGGLESSVFFSDATISSANLDRTGKRVKFEIKLQRAQ
jgi:general secretion pathway protein L